MKPVIKISQCYKKNAATWAGSKFVCIGKRTVGLLGFGPTMREAYNDWLSKQKSGMMDPH